ncbi:MAG: leucine-rich repeat domain-containing protein, partial [Bifidobacteriaceae bacterium]|nr:leucine-rich repeat domain-containing protein [Bifidobacteriaceae bacterium]
MVKGFGRCAVVVALAGGLVAASGVGPVFGVPVTGMDPALLGCVNVALGRAVDAVLDSADPAVLGLRTLECYRKRVVSLDGIEALAGLEELSVYGNQITDLTPVGSLVRLEELSVYGNQITDLTPVEALPNLRKLNASENPLGDSSQVANLTG